MSGFLRVHDGRTSQDYTIPVTDNSVRGSDLTKIKGPVDGGDQSAAVGGSGLKVHDAGFQNTVVMKSSIAYADGERGTLEFRGRRVQDLARDQDYEDVSYLLIWNRLPSPDQKQTFRNDVSTACQMVPQSVVDVIHAFPRSTPFIPMVLAGLSAYAGSDPGAIPAVVGRNLYLGNSALLDRAITRVMAAYAVVVGLVHSHRHGQPFTPANGGSSYLSNLLSMMGLGDDSAGPSPADRVSLIEKLWILGADHELTNSTSALLHVASTLADPISCIIGAVASSYGPLHFGAAESGYLTMKQIATPDKVAESIARVKAGKQRLMGVGHRVYKDKDPRVEPVKAILKDLKDQGRADPLVAVAEEIERCVVGDEFFRKRRLCINVDLYWPFVYTSLGIPSEAILPMFMASRMPGFMAHWREAMTQPPKLWRPNQEYVGRRADDTPKAKL